MTGSTVNPMPPHTFPYLVDRFFYTGASSAADTGGTLVGSPTGDGWFKMFEFFEVPSQMMGATGPVAQGTNFDWDRQDTKPGLLNLNLIIDEEVFFSVVGQQDANFNQQWLNFIQVPSIPPGTYSLPLNGQAPIPQYGPPVPLVVTAIDAHGSPAYVYPITNQGVTGTDPILAALNQGNPPVQPDRRQPDQGGLRPVPVAAARRLGLPLRVRERSRGPEQRGRADRPADPGAGRLRLGHPGGAAVPLAVVPRHRLHRDAPGDAPAVAVHQPAEHGRDLVHGRSGREESQSLPGLPDAERPDGQRGGAGGTPAYPGAIPVRRLFQVPDANAESNASEPGDTFINNQEPTPPANHGGRIPLRRPRRARCPRSRFGQWDAGGLRVQSGISEPGLVHLAGQQLPRFFRSPVTSVGLGQPSDPSSTLLDAASTRTGGSRCCSGS